MQILCFPRLGRPRSPPPGGPWVCVCEPNLLESLKGGVRRTCPYLTFTLPYLCLTLTWVPSGTPRAPRGRGAVPLRTMGGPIENPWVGPWAPWTPWWTGSYGNGALDKEGPPFLGGRPDSWTIIARSLGMTKEKERRRTRPSAWSSSMPKALPFFIFLFFSNCWYCWWYDNAFSWPRNCELRL